MSPQQIYNEANAAGNHDSAVQAVYSAGVEEGRQRALAEMPLLMLTPGSGANGVVDVSADPAVSER